MINIEAAPSLHTAVQQLLSHRLTDQKTASNHEPRPDGRHVLEPQICSINGSRWHCRQRLAVSHIKELHNEGGQSAARYPLSINKGLFFSESLSTMNAAANAYQDLATASIKAIASEMKGDVLPFTVFDKVGHEIQTLDAQFAKSHINHPLDQLHQCMGPDPNHPYSKITVLRTTFPVDVGGSIISFFFEKFLVSYSYLDLSGMRRSTVTPIHSHPLNYETVYFAAYGKTSHAIEREFYLALETGEPLMQNDGSPHPIFANSVHDYRNMPIKLIPGPTQSLNAGSEPILLRPFNSENVFKKNAELIMATDGLFRPHQVTVVDDPEKETRYFALDNYFGPAGRVFVYDDNGRVNLWSHNAWD